MQVTPSRSREQGGGQGQVSPTHKLEPSGKNSQTHKKNKDTINGPLSFLLLCVRYCCQGGLISVFLLDWFGGVLFLDGCHFWSVIKFTKQIMHLFCAG